MASLTLPCRSVLLVMHPSTSSLPGLQAREPRICPTCGSALTHPGRQRYWRHLPTFRSAFSPAEPHTMMF